MHKQYETESSTQFMRSY